MSQQCEGFSRPLTSDRLERCPYDAPWGERYCAYHDKVAAGLIVGAVWDPTRWSEKREIERLVEATDPLMMLIREWA